MATYRFTWNPRRFVWNELPSEAQRTRRGERAEDWWSCGITRRIASGDRFFLVRLGEMPKGIIGSGRVLSDPKARQHWDARKSASGVKEFAVDEVARRTQMAQR